VTWAGRGQRGLHAGDVAMLRRLPELVADLRLTLTAHVRASTAMTETGIKERGFATEDAARGGKGRETAMKARGGVVEQGGGERDACFAGRGGIGCRTEERERKKGLEAGRRVMNGWGEREGQLTNDTHLYLAKLSMLSVAAGARDHTMPMLASHL
jgi:hypothetical protein